MNRSQAGMTLLEVLVAAVIMAVAVVGLFTSLTTSMRGAARLTDYDRCALLAQSKMDELLALSKLPRIGTLEGQFDPVVAGGLRAGWKAAVSRFEALPGGPVGSPALDRIDLEVWWEAGEQRRSFRMEGFRRTEISPEEAAQGVPQ